MIAPVLLALLASAGATAATGSDKPLIAPPAAWVHQAPLPANSSKPDEAAVKLLLQDNQLRLLPGGGDAYSETVMRVQTPQGLAALGTVSLPWKPDTSTLTVHKLHIIRAGKVIDVLDGGTGFTVLRRENNLEQATLDGILTAAIQPEGLQVGDLIDLAMTVHTDDPALAGHTEGLAAAIGALPTEHLRLRMLWDSSLPVRWRQIEGLPKLAERKVGGMTEISVAADDLKPIIPPKGAPPRFLFTRQIEATSYRGWPDMAAAFAPLYDKAAALKAESPLKVEIARIAAASPDPAARAEAALKLVQEQVRYVFLGMNDGGLVPAGADLTWQRRFGDCKGKTALLLALLHGLGIQAEPAIVSSVLGDGMDQRLPLVALFDHVIVRATIGGQVYWLDGTRMGDRRLADIQVPAFRWALPLRPGGSALEPLVMKVPDKPLREYRFRLDMRGGINQQLPFHVEEVSRGDAATILHLQLDNMAPDVRDRSLRDYMKSNYKEATVTNVAAAFDPASGEETLVMDGTVKHDWRYQTYDGDRAGLGDEEDLSRPAGPHAEAPYNVDFPTFIRTSETILLPGNGKGFVVDAPPVDKTIAGIEYHRHGKIEDGTFTLETSQRALAREFPASEAAAAQAALAELNKTRAALRVTPDYVSTAAEAADFAKAPHSPAETHALLASALVRKQDLAGALAEFDKAIAADPNYPAAYIDRGSVYWSLGRKAEARASVDKAIELVPNFVYARMIRASFATSEDDPAAALPDLDKVLAMQPDYARARLLRGQVHAALGHREPALADSAVAISRDPHLVDAYLLRANLFFRDHRTNEGLAEAENVTKANPTADYAYVVAGAIYARFNKRAEAQQAFDRAIAIKPTVYAYLTRADNRAPDDLVGRRSDIQMALKLKPNDPAALVTAAGQAMRDHDWSGAIAFADRSLQLKPENMTMLSLRGLARSLSGHEEAGAKDLAAARVLAGSDPVRLNGLCWDKALYNAALKTGLEECDAALRLQPKRAAIIDSRGYILLRLNRYAEAIGAFDSALAISPTTSSSLFGRGIARLKLGKIEDAKADLAAAVRMDPGVQQQFASYGITP